MAYTTINKSGDYFNTKLYTGNGSSGHAITGVGFRPDFNWIKNRGAANSHIIHDVLRGVGYELQSNTTAAQGTADPFTSFDSDGFTLGGGGGGINGNSETYVSWNWKANGAGSANTDGTINTTATSVNTTAGFSISTYAGTGSNGTIGHGLGVAPKMIIIKRTSGTEDWLVYTTADGSLDYLVLNSTGASGNSGNAVPTNSVWSVGSNQVQNASGSNYVAYCFADVTGYSKIGSYTGTGVADGTFVYTGFKPAFILQKRTNSATTGWGIIDNTRSPNNEMRNMLLANSNAVEDTSAAPAVDFLSNGFKWRTADGWFNGGGDPHIYMAFAEAPLVGSNNVPCTAR
jgi:hypothetical protein